MTYEKLHNFKAVHIIGQKIQARENTKKTVKKHELHKEPLSKNHRKFIFHLRSLYFCKINIDYAETILEFFQVNWKQPLLDILLENSHFVIFLRWQNS